MKSLALAIASVLLVLVIAEVGLRSAGYESRRPRPMVVELPRMSERDAELGWVSLPGIYRYRHMGRSIQTTIQPNGARGAAGGNGREGEIWFFGCSYTEGWGLTDGQEFPALVARRAPDWIVRNFAVPGYSTLQAQLLYERLVGALQQKPRLVVYGYAGFHEYRNTADPKWLVNLRRIAGENEWIELPYARWSAAKGLREFPPKHYVEWPLSEYSALVRRVSFRVATLGDVASPDEQREVALAILDRWQRRVEREGGEFVTMVLAARPRMAAILPAAFEARNVPYLRCLDTGFPSPDTQLPDGHPNESVNLLWADCFMEWLDARRAPPPGRIRR